MKTFSFSIFTAIGAGAAAAAFLQMGGLIASAPSGVAPVVSQGKLFMVVATPTLYSRKLAKP